MMDGEEKQEIIIVRRVMGGDDGHHGGAWKIAFADFMTAMMALFLVLWLVNAANEKTKKSVASYFNPVKLIDRTRSTKGLDKATSSDTPKDTKEGENVDKEKVNEEATIPEANVRDGEFFKDPFAVLDGIATEALERIDIAQSILDLENVTSAPAEDAFLDPFAQLIERPVANDPQLPSIDTQGSNSGSPRVALNPNLATPEKVDGPTQPVDTTEEASKEVVLKTIEKMEPEQKDLDRENPKAKISLSPQAETPPARDSKQQEEEKLLREPKPEADKPIEKISAEILKEIKERLANKLGEEERISESLTVRVTKEGILISITDQFGFSMFQVGSAVPKGEIVLAMSEISSVLAEREGMVRIYGHTDARPYAGQEYDNWRLSTARAHSARLMLTRGGLKRSRVSQVVGFADRILRLPNTPESEANRRIEILLEVS